MKKGAKVNKKSFILERKKKFLHQMPNLMVTDVEKVDDFAFLG